MNSLPETDLRQGVTPVQHQVLDLLDSREPMWRMMKVQELVDLAECEMFEVSAPRVDWPKIAALALHIAQRQAEAAGKAAA